MRDSCSSRLSPSSSSTGSSHMSLCTSLSSPPPSPSASKTYAFFASPFADDPATPQPPPNPHSRQGSSEVSTDDKFSQTPPSRNTDFFAVSLLPTPPPSIRSLSHSTSASNFHGDTDGHSDGPHSRETSLSPPPYRHHVALPPLSRFFPSRARYGSESDGQPSYERTNVRRELVSLDSDSGAPHRNGPSPDPYHAGEPTESPVDDHHLPSQVTPTPSAEHHPQAFGLTLKLSQPPTPPSEPDQPLPTKLEPGATLSSSSLTLELVKPLGTGSFSSVWLARDTQGQLNALELVRKSSLARSKSLRGRRSRTMDGTRPSGRRRGKAREGSEPGVNMPKSPLLSPTDELPPGQGRQKKRSGRLVAVKMTDRMVCDPSSRSRVSFVREVEVLRHISHPSIVSYLHSFSTPAYHCLVLEHVGGGELLELVDNPASHSRVDEPLVRRLWGELCRAVAWMHSVGLVHRDIKLENILLTADPFVHPLPTHSLIKLTDFGLSRFVDAAHPQLTTLCGSDSYAAPELIMGRPYDGRETDAWACGVVLYALATRRLPFDPSPTSPLQASPMPDTEHLEADWEVQRRKRAVRKALLTRIAVGAYEWPDVDAAGPPPLKGAALAGSEGIRRVAGRLLVRDPRKRSRVADIWVDEWMHGEGAPPPPALHPEGEASMPLSLPSSPQSGLAEGAARHDAEFEVDLDADVDADDIDEGVLVDGEDIGPESVARQEH